MKTRVLSALLAALALTLSPLFAQRDTDPGRLKAAPTVKDWVQLFNGKNLDGWTPKVTGYPLGENYADTFRVENGVLKVSYDKYTAFENKFGHLFYSREKFSYYTLAADTAS